MSNSFDPIILPPGYAYGFSGGPAFDTRITRMDGGGEQRVQIQEEPAWRWSAMRRNFGDGADVSKLVDWFLARRGALYGFLFLDAADFSTANDKRSAPSMLDQVIGFGDGATTRFRLRKQYADPGGMTARAFPRRVVPMTGTASAPVARLFDVPTGQDLTPTAAVDGAQDFGAQFFPMSQEVQLSAAPAIGEQVTWGGYFTVPARFSETTDQGFEATIEGFEADTAPFEVESIPFDDPVPLVAGGSPYGAITLASQATDFELSGRRVHLWEVEAGAPISGYLDSLDNYPTGGRHLRLVNTGGQTITVRDALGNSIGTVSGGSRADLYVKETEAGVRTPVLY
jgi:uncharacterized protein (TIGR02217 family)